jgi:hypothetical protein
MRKSLHRCGPKLERSVENSLEYMAARLRNIRNLEPVAAPVRKPRIRAREAAWQPALAIRPAAGQTERLKAKSREYGR